jgi:hypothetical protein
MTAASLIRAVSLSIRAKGCCFSTAAAIACWLSADGIVVRGTGQMEGLNPGGGTFGPDGHYFVGSRSRSTVMAFAPALDAAGEPFLPAAIVQFPRGFAFGHDGRFFLASGIDPNGVGDNAVVAFDPGERMGPVGWSATRNSTLLIWRSQPTATSSYRASTRSACRMPRRPFANTAPRTDILSATSRPAAWPNFAGRAVCALGLMAISTASPRTRLSRSIPIAADVWGPHCDFPDCTAKRWCSFLKRQ